MKIVTLTMNPSIDMNIHVENITAERKLRTKPASYEPGGGGINVSRAIRKLGGESTSIFPTGGANGKMLLELLNNELIKIVPAEVKNHTRININITEDSTNNQYRFITPGPELSEKEWHNCLDIVLDQKADYIVASGSLPQGVPDNFYAILARLGHELGINIIIDTSKTALKKAVDEGVFLIKPNMNEIRDLIGYSVSNEREIITAAKEVLAGSKTKYIIISLGAGGAVFISKEIIKHLRAPVVPIQSRVGAGDSMIAGVITGIFRGYNILDAVQFGIAAGTAATMTPGTELCRKEDTEKLYDIIKSENK